MKAMQMTHLRFAGLAFVLTLLTACMGPQTPQEVAAAFWEGVTLDDAGDIVEYSTLDSVDGYDRFSRDDWSGVGVSWGKVVIDGREAKIETQLSYPGRAGDDKLTFPTHLVREGDRWLVDYRRTADEFRANAALDSIVQQVGAIGRKISSQFGRASRTSWVGMPQCASWSRSKGMPL